MATQKRMIAKYTVPNVFMHIMENPHCKGQLTEVRYDDGSKRQWFTYIKRTGDDTFATEQVEIPRARFLNDVKWKTRKWYRVTIADILR